MENKVDNKCKKTIFELEVLAYVFLLPIIVDFFNVIVNQFKLGNPSLITTFIYIVSLLIILIKGFKHIRINDVLLCFVSIIPFILSYFLFSGSRQFLFKQDMLIIYVFFFPISILYIKNINDWRDFYRIFEKFGEIAISLAVFILLFLDYSSYLVYMGFSYALLPFIAVIYRKARSISSLKSWLFFFTGLITILIFGARAAFLFIIIYIILYELFTKRISSRKNMLTLFLVGVMAGIIFLFYDSFMNSIAHISILNNSYIVQRLIQGKLFEAETRNILYENCRNRINCMGLEVSGFFGDRRYCMGFAYPHNIIYEVLMSWGWIIGIIFLIVLFAMIMKVIVTKNLSIREIAILFIVTCFLKFFVSGSYLIDGKFWLFISILSALSKAIKCEKVCSTDNNEKENLIEMI